LSLTFFTGDDWDILITLNRNGTPQDVSGASSIDASIVSSDDDNVTTLIAAVSLNSGATGADWSNGVVLAEFPAASTGVATGIAYVELQVTEGGKKTTWPRQAIIVKTGTIA
jgi:hypothetical protein